MSKVTPLKKRAHYHDEFVADLLVEHSTLPKEQQARAVLSRMQRTYSHLTIDGTDYILVPSKQSPIGEDTAA